ncbi:DUF5677 domain-containing protein [Lysinibacillus fusiformis]|uniref:DUF5677 domain-containing protein n=1 Tax=Lysinibacillus fusiformis TaxID=28031 RepID=UPI0030174C6E
MIEKTSEVDILETLFEGFLDKVIVTENLNFDEDTIVKDIEKISEEIVKEEGEYKQYIEENLRSLGYRLREDNRLNERVFLANLERDYGYIFYHLELVYLLSVELGKCIHGKFDKDESPLITVMTFNHVRACSMLAEVLHLIKGGYGNGAIARFRSLHELSVVSEFIFEKKEPAAEAFLDYLEVMKVKDALYLKQLYGSEKKIEEVLKNYKNIKQKFILKYGIRFADEKSKCDYEWARGFLNINEKSFPSFAMIRSNINRKTGREQYKLSSNNIHSAPKSIISNINTKTGYPIAGASNIGLAEPGNWSIYEMQIMNTQLMKLVLKSKDFSFIDIIKIQFIIKNIQILCNYSYEKFGKIENIFKKNEG